MKSETGVCYTLHTHTEKGGLMFRNKAYTLHPTLLTQKNEPYHHHPLNQVLVEPIQLRGLTLLITRGT